MRAFFPSMFGPVDRHLFAEGNHHRLWEILGAHRVTHAGVTGVHFAVWAPNAQSVRVVGDFCHWDGNAYPLSPVHTTGIFEGFVPDVPAGALYKFEIHTADGSVVQKADPMARWCEAPPATASRVYASDYVWNDLAWLQRRRTHSMPQSPLAIYEVHLGSWARHTDDGNRVFTYRELAPKLVHHVLSLGFNAIELLPVAEHPFTGSWGYQVTGYYAPTARYGTPDDFKFFVDYCHQYNVMVIIDWVPAHFPKDDFALRCFDGTPLYEHADPRRGLHPDWDTLIFNYGRHEVRNFLVANALYWLEVFHIDGLRVDAVASMLYLNYSRKDGAWLPNVHGGHDNLEAIAFLQQLNTVIHALHPDCITIAEESTAWRGVTHAVDTGGLGFTFKWNMGWMHDTLEYFGLNPIYRKHHQDQLTFASLYEQHERFIMPLSHDEVVHGKGSLLRRMPGDRWQQFANLRCLLTYQMTRPGKKLLFMGNEFAQDAEWDHDRSLDWHLLQSHEHHALLACVKALGHLYQNTACLWQADHLPEGFRWIDHHNQDQSVLVYARFAQGSGAEVTSGNANYCVVILNLTPIPREDYRIGVPLRTDHILCFNSDDAQFGGSDYMQARAHARSHTQNMAFQSDGMGAVSVSDIPWQDYDQSIVLDLPPLAALIVRPQT